MNQLSDIRLKWYDDSSLTEDDPRKIIELFLDSLGITSDVARDLTEVLLINRKIDRALTSNELRGQIIAFREKRGVGDRGLTLRNLQVWLRYFREIKLIDKVGDRYMFKGNKKPSQAFREYTKPIVDESAEYVARILERVEEVYGI